jgi:hypothetical protein
MSRSALCNRAEGSPATDLRRATVEQLDSVAPVPSLSEMSPQRAW